MVLPRTKWCLVSCERIKLRLRSSCIPPSRALCLLATGITKRSALIVDRVYHREYMSRGGTDYII